MSADERAGPPRVGRPDVLEVEVEGRLVLYDPVAERAHVLDGRSRRTWVGLTGGREAAPDAGRDDDAVAALAELAELGLLVDPADRVPRRDAASVREPPVRPGTFCTRALELADRRVVVSSDDPALVAAVAWYAAPMAVDARPTAAFRLEPSPDGERRVPAWLNRVATRTAGCTVVHAAGAVAGGSAVVFPGGPGAGKSTLVAVLVASGLGYLGDEAVGVGPDGEAHACPKRIALERGSWELVGDEGAHRRAARAGFDPTRVHWVDPCDLHPAALAWRHDPDARPIARLVVAPTFVPGAAVELHRLEPIDAFTMLVGNATNLPLVGAAGLETFRRLAHDVPCFALRHGGVRDAVAALRPLLAEHGLAVP